MQGVVHRVEHKHVLLRFVETFRALSGEKYDIRFVLNRMPYQRYHQAVDNCSRAELLRFTFPAPAMLDFDDRRDVGSLFNRMLGNNVQQREAVEKVCAQTPGSAPFVIIGP